VGLLDRFSWLFGKKSGESAADPLAVPSVPKAPASPPSSALLSELLAALSDAAFRSTESVRTQHLADVDQLYDKSSDSVGDVFTPKTMRLAVTPFVLPAEGDPAPLEVPIAAMMQSNPLTVDEINFELDCTALRLRLGSTSDTLKASDIEIGFGGPGSVGTPLKVSIRFKSGEAPQAKARIGDALIRGVQ
jgi:hypothetical protein